MGSAVLVDSNIFIGLMRLGLDPADQLDAWAGTRDLATCGMVRVEVLRGIRVKKSFDLIEAYINVMLNVPTDNKLWEETAELAWQLDRKGIVLPAQDILIAASARRIEAEVLSDDRHFSSIPGIRIAGGLEDLLGD